MIKKKLKTCIECKKDRVIWSKGRCISCAQKKGKPLTKKPIRPFSKTKKKKEGYGAFYQSEILKYQERPYSVQSNTYIFEVGTVNIAHIFPKQTYKSIARNPDNIILLTWDEHTRFDQLLGALEFEKLEVEFENCWGIICKRVLKLLPLISENGKLVRKFREHLNQ